MNRGKILAVLIACSAALGVMAQTDRSEVKKSIAQIKKSSSYIYADITAPTAEEAQQVAEETLYAKINEWAATNKKLRGAENFLVKDKNIKFETLSTTRGDMYQAVVYVKKSDIQRADNVEVIENTGETSATATGNTRKTENVPVATAVKNDTYQSVYPDIIKKIATLTTYDKLVEVIKAGKEGGSISGYARYTKEQTDAEAYYFAVYDRSGKVVALLTPGAARSNVMTGETDSIENYKGCGAIIFKTK